MNENVPTDPYDLFMEFNKQLSATLDEIADMLALTGANSFKVSANQRAARAIREHPGDLKTIADNPAKVTAIEGVGKSIATKIAEFAESGQIIEHKDLARRVPQGLLTLLAVPGLGHKTVKLLWDKLGVETIEDLTRAIDDGSILELPRMGPKKADNIRASLELATKSTERLRLGLAMPIAEALVARLAAVRGVQRAAHAGSLRRGRETIGDIDILVATDDPTPVRDAFTTAPGVTHISAAGETKCSVRVALEGGGLAGGDQTIQVDLRIVPLDRWGAAMMYFTGSMDHNVRLRERATKRGMTLNEYGLFKDEGIDDRPPQQRGLAPIAADTESAVFRALGLPMIPPPMREDRGELTLQETPRLVQTADIRADLHTHTTDSDGKMSLEESARIARGRGFHTLAITDHSRSSTIANGLDVDRLRAQIAAVHKFDAETGGITVLAGSEVDILSDGQLDYDDDLLASLDVVVASPHVALQQDPAKATARLLRAIAHPMVHIIGHPTGRLIGKRPGLEPAMDELIAACVEHDVALEINANWQRLDLRAEHVRMAQAAGCKIAINCDVHHATDYDNLRYGVLTAQRGWLETDLCINTWPKRKLHGWLRGKR